MAERDAYRAELGRKHDAQWAAWAATAASEAALSPVATSRLAAEVWDVGFRHDWVLTAGTAAGWAPRLWDFDAPYRHPGASLGTATQIGISLGVALANRGTGRLVVDLQPDGDLMFDAGALWVASYYRLPLLVVMFNNRAYYNDWEHQERLARQRSTPIERAYIGMEIDQPAPGLRHAGPVLLLVRGGPDRRPGQGQRTRSAAPPITSSGRALPPWWTSSAAAAEPSARPLSVVRSSRAQQS